MAILIKIKTYLNNPSILLVSAVIVYALYPLLVFLQAQKMGTGFNFGLGFLDQYLHLTRLMKLVLASMILCFFLNQIWQLKKKFFQVNYIYEKFLFLILIYVIFTFCLGLVYKNSLVLIFSHSFSLLLVPVGYLSLRFNYGNKKPEHIFRNIVLAFLTIFVIEFFTQLFWLGNIFNFGKSFQEMASLSVQLPLIYFLNLENKNTKHLFLIVFLAMGGILTFKRLVWLAMVIAVALAFIFAKNKKKMLIDYGKILIISFFILASLLAAFQEQLAPLTATLKGKFIDIFNFFQLKKSSLDGRLASFLTVKELFSHNFNFFNYVFGFGLGKDLGGMFTDDMFTYFLSKMGVLSLFLVLFFYFLLTQQMFRQIKNSQHAFYFKIFFTLLIIGWANMIFSYVFVDDVFLLIILCLSGYFLRQEKQACLSVPCGIVS